MPAVLWETMWVTDRKDLLHEFLTGAGWSTGQRSPLAGDASTRRYERLIGPKGRAVLMDAPPGAEAPSCPPDASVAERQTLGYNALARLAGPDTAPFVAIGHWLNGLGLSAPRVLAADLTHGFLLLEDLGDTLFTKVVGRGARSTDLYRAAVDILVDLHDQTPPAQLPLPDGGHVQLSLYDETALRAEVNLLIEWFLPVITGKPVSDAVRRSYEAAWDSAFDHVVDPKPVLVLRDYHADNLIWLPERDGVARVGLLDFQDGVIGARAYDLVSLLQDARRDVPQALGQDMLSYYCRRVAARDPAFDESVFRVTYAALGAQRNAKIVGIFARLFRRDGKAQYLPYLPRVWRYLEADLNHDALVEIKSWFDAHVPPRFRTEPLGVEGDSHG